jgi:signal transduction histidine kinase
MNNYKIFEEISVKDSQALHQEVKKLQMEVSRLQMENCDLENSLLTAIEHGDLIESDLLDVNKRLKSEIIERKMAQATLQSILEIVYRDKNDLEIMLSTATEHGDAIEHEQYSRAVETIIALSESEANLREQKNLLEHRVEERTLDLKQAKEAAESASRSKAAFLANMSHELRTPLNAILGFAHLMLYDRELNEQHQSDLQTICNSGNHLLTMINDILEMSKLEAGTVLLREKECDLYDIVDIAKGMLSLKAQEKELSFDFIIHPNLSLYIYADEGKLRQILINLISNAIKFTDAVGHIWVRIFPEEILDASGQRSPTHYHLCFEVEDTGAGISESELPTLFKPFVQTDSGRRSQEGTGLGLSICYSYVQLMGGQMSITSKVGYGSTFRFHIPVKSLASTQI